MTVVTRMEDSAIQSHVNFDHASLNRVSNVVLCDSGKILSVSSTSTPIRARVSLHSFGRSRETRTMRGYFDPTVFSEWWRTSVPAR